MTSGEEDEKRIMQTSCKLYQFCPVGKTWIDRGGGTLRLNEKEQDGVSTSRLVVRSKAVMRVGNVLCGPGYNYMQLHTITDNYIQLQTDEILRKKRTSRNFDFWCI